MVHKYKRIHIKRVEKHIFSQNFARLTNKKRNDGKSPWQRRSLPSPSPPTSDESLATLKLSSTLPL